MIQAPGRLVSVLALVASGTLALSLSTPGAQQKVTLQQVVDRTLAARGGVDALKGLRSVKRTGRATVQGTAAPVSIWSKRPNRVRRLLEISGAPVTLAYDGRVFWTATGTADADAAPVTGYAAERAALEARFDPVFLTYRDEGIQLEVVGEEDRDGGRAVVVRARHASGRIETYWIDTTTWLETRWESGLERNGVPVTLAREYAAYRQVERLMLPGVVREFVNGALVSEATFETIELNPPLEDRFFSLPAHVR